jgi:O-antigen/teichoic acid export membrane protein
MTEERKIEIVYRRWVLLIPFIMIISGMLLVYFFWILNPFIGLLGGALILVGVMVLGILLVLVISFYVSVRSLKRSRPTPPPLSEELEKAEQDSTPSEDHDEDTQT